LPQTTGYQTGLNGQFGISRSFNENAWRILLKFESFDYETLDAGTGRFFAQIQRPPGITHAAKSDLQPPVHHDRSP
jgi:hypothetical protein